MKTADPNQDNVRIFTELYYEIHEFMKTFETLFSCHPIGARRQRPFCRMSVCEIMTVLTGFQVIGGQKFQTVLEGYSFSVSPVGIPVHCFMQPVHGGGSGGDNSSYAVSEIPHGDESEHHDICH